LPAIKPLHKQNVNYFLAKVAKNEIGIEILAQRDYKSKIFCFQIMPKAFLPAKSGRA
jgi:hypothetical protein